MPQLTENVQDAIVAIQKSSLDMHQLTRKNMAFEMVKMEAHIKMNVLDKLSQIVRDVKG